MEKNEAAEALRVRAWERAHSGYTGDAAILFGRLIHEYPGSEAAAEAQKYLDNPSPPIVARAERVTVVDIDISFGQLVALFVKAAIAMIPAAIILGIIGFIAFEVASALVGAGSGFP